MLVGEYAGMKVQEAKRLIKMKLLELGHAVIYSEPEKKVMSRKRRYVIRCKEEICMALTLLF